MIENREESEFGFMKLLFGYIYRRLNFQHFLYFCVFITFDIGDTVTAAIMMDSKGLDVEYNPIIRYIYFNFGLSGLIAAKLWFIIVPLMIASMRVKDSFWFINGVLVSLILFGLLAIQANIQEISGLEHMSPTEINTIYLVALLLFTFAGTIIDNYVKVKAQNSFSNRIKGLNKKYSSTFK
ncbi:MAG: hypothetical protein FIB07_00080 [Candidatus Methanoperedens sp.]|nr:hypothetical protein [Candidatus Methanoperedens sp.]